MQCLGLKGEALLFETISSTQCSTVGPFTVMMQKVSFDVIPSFNPFPMTGVIVISMLLREDC